MCARSSVCVCVCVRDRTYIHITHQQVHSWKVPSSGSRSASGHVPADSTLQRTRLTLTVTHLVLPLERNSQRCVVRSFEFFETTSWKHLGRQTIGYSSMCVEKSL